MSSAQMKLYKDGFQLIKGAIPADVVDALLASTSTAEDWYTIFKEGDEQDDYRLQTEVPKGEAVDNVAAVVLGVAGSYSENWVVG